MNSGVPGAQPIVEAVNSAASGAAAAVNSVASGAVAAVNGAVNAVKNAAANVAKAANAAVANAPVLNSLIPLGGNTPAAPPANSGAKPANNAAKPANNGAKPANNGAKRNNAGNAGAGGIGELFENITKSPDQNIGGLNIAGAPAANAGTNTASPPATFGNFNVSKNAATNAAAQFASPLGIFIALVVGFLIVFAVFNKQIKQGYEYFAQSVKQALGISTVTDVAAQITPSQGTIQEVTMPPQPPQAILPAQQQLQQQNIVEKILPSAGSNEVFNVAHNKFTYYDAEPLCKALGAELASYEQVKEAWGRGADWCNYGWVKGQMAIYPTQKDTYEKLQAGPADEQLACGTTGINGGFFDNPEMRFGVNCYGKKPSQSAHDEAKLMEEGKIPRSPETLKVDRLVAEFKQEKDSLFVKPFSDNKWSSA